MEEQFILRVPPAVAERIERLLNDSSGSSEDKNLDMVFSGSIIYTLLFFNLLSSLLW